MNDVGEWLKERRRVKRLSLRGLAAIAQLSERTIRNYESEGLPASRTQFEKLDRYVDALGLLPAAVDKLMRGEIPSDRELTNREPELTVVSTGQNFPLVFNLGIAASGWVELRGHGYTGGVIAKGTNWIIVRVAGDSMDPRYRDGQYVMFRILNPEEDSPVPGEDYFFVRSDNHGTFKRLASVSEDGYELRALNPKYENRLRVSKDEVVMVGEARFIVNDIPDEG